MLCCLLEKYEKELNAVSFGALKNYGKGLMLLQFDFKKKIFPTGYNDTTFLISTRGSVTRLPSLVYYSKTQCPCLKQTPPFLSVSIRKVTYLMYMVFNIFFFRQIFRRLKLLPCHNFSKRQTS